jgi:tetratricopeptide (TPR) repeat protein
MIVTAVGACGRALAAPPQPAGATPATVSPTPLVLDDQPVLLVPKQPRTEAESDVLDALALFSTARLREHRGDLAEALRLYQRALRRDPKAAVVARSIIPLAARLQRHDEAVRYALKVVDLEPPDPDLLKSLGLHVQETGDLARAVTLYEKAATCRKPGAATGSDVVLWMEIGRLYHALGKHDRAAEWFLRVWNALEHPATSGIKTPVRKKLPGDLGPAYTLMGEAFLLAGQPDRAMAAFEQADRVAPTPGLLAYHSARVELRAGRPQQAIERLDAYFRAKTPVADVAPYRLLGEALKALHKEGELISRLEKLRASDPDNVPLGYFLAEKYREAGRFEQAETLYRASLAKSPTLLGYRGLIDVYRKTKRFDPLLGVLGEAVVKVGSLGPLAEKSNALAADTPLVRALVDLARRQARLDPKTLPPYEARLAVAMLALDAKEWDAAAEFFDRAIQAKPGEASELLLTWGLGLLMKEQYGRAVEVFRRGTGVPSEPEARHQFLFSLAGALELNGKTDEALDAARQAVALAQQRDVAHAAKAKKDEPPLPEMPRFQSRIAWVFYHAKRYDEADQAYRDLLAKYGAEYRWPEVRQVLREARLALSNLAVIRGDMPAAEEWLEQVLDEFPDDPSALNDLGYLWADAGRRLDRAEEMIRKALESEPDNAAYRDSLGWVLYRLGRTAEAVAELEKAAAQEPEPTVLDHLGDAYQKAGQADKAKKAWRRAAEAHQKAGEPDKAGQIEKKLRLPT